MTILGIDYGLKKVGLAVVDTVNNLTEPIAVISPNEVIDWIRKNRFTYPIASVIIGVTGGKLDKHIRAFGHQIETSLALSITYFDETLSTQDAQAGLRLIRAGRKKVKGKEDAVAAAIMLQSYLEGRKND